VAIYGHINKQMLHNDMTRTLQHSGFQPESRTLIRVVHHF